MHLQFELPEQILLASHEASGLSAGFFLPRGYPDTVTPDYLSFQLWAVPAHISGWMSTSLATSSLLKAVGVGDSAVGATAAAAAIKWITKDGIGAAGRVLVSRPMTLHLAAKAVTVRGSEIQFLACRPADCLSA